MATATDQALGTVVLAGDLAGGSDPTNPQLTPTGAIPGEYKAPGLVVDAKGRIIYARQVGASDVGCATPTNCGTVALGPFIKSEVIDKDNTKISLEVASTDKFGVVKLGSGFKKDCCEMYVDYPEATPTVLGTVTVPIAGNLTIGLDGTLSSPAATASVAGVVKATDGNGLTLASGTLNFTPADSGVGKGFAQVGTGFNVAGGVISVPTADTSTSGVYRFNGTDFQFDAASTTFSYTTAVLPGLNGPGFVKIGTGLLVDTDGTLSRGVGAATSTTKGIVSVPTANGLSVSGGVVSYTPVTATTVVKGQVQVGSGLAVAAGVVSAPDATNSTLGLIGTANANNLTINNGVISFGPGIAGKTTLNTFTKAQVVAKVPVSYTSSVALNFSLGNVFDITLTGNITFAAPTNSVNGGHYIVIVRQDATGNRTFGFNAVWKFADSFGATDNGKTISKLANSISIIHVTVVDGVPLAQIARNFA